jgi:hypothetical protein
MPARVRRLIASASGKSRADGALDSALPTKTLATALFSAALRERIFVHAIKRAAMQNARTGISEPDLRLRDRRTGETRRRPRAALRDRIFLGDE